MEYTVMVMDSSWAVLIIRHQELQRIWTHLIMYLKDALQKVIMHLDLTVITRMVLLL